MGKFNIRSFILVIKLIEVLEIVLYHLKRGVNYQGEIFEINKKVEPACRRLDSHRIRRLKRFFDFFQEKFQPR